MRTSAELLAYSETGHLTCLDYHAEYFLEFVLVHFLSEVMGFNYILVYFFATRIFAVLLWAFLFFWSKRIMEEKRSSYAILLLIASSMLLAGQSYNLETSFAPILFVMFFVMMFSGVNRNKAVCMFILVVGIMFASFRETLMLCITSLVAIFSSLFMRNNGSLILRRNNKTLTSLLAASYLISAARIFQFSSISYFATYKDWFVSLINSIGDILKEFSIRSKFLETITTISNPIDRSIALISVVSTLFLMTSLAFLGLVVMISQLKRRVLWSALFGIIFTYLLAFSFEIAAYGVLKILGTGPLRDFSSATVLVRTMIPVVVFAIFPFIGTEKGRKRFSRLFNFIVVTGLIMILVFSPFLFARKEVKSSYDMLKMPLDQNEITLYSNNLFNFLVSHAPKKVWILVDPSASFFRGYYFLLVQYKIGIKMPQGSLESILQSVVFDNGLYGISVDPMAKGLFVDARAQT